MNDILLNYHFFDYVNFEMLENSSILENISDYKKIRKECSKANEEIEKLEDTKVKKFLENITNCYEQMENYQQALAYYLGMKHIINMEQLKK